MRYIAHRMMPSVKRCLAGRGRAATSMGDRAAGKLRQSPVEPHVPGQWHAERQTAESGGEGDIELVRGGADVCAKHPAQVSFRYREPRREFGLQRWHARNP